MFSLAAALLLAFDAPFAGPEQALVGPVIEQATLQRSYPARVFRGRREHFEFFMDNMAACSVLSERLGLIAYRAEEDEAGRVIADDRLGARGSILRVYCAEGRRVYFVEGRQQGVFQARGRGVVVVEFEQTSPDTIQYTGQMFVKIDNEVLARLAQVFYAFVKRTVDRHFDHVMNQPLVLSGLALDDPGVLRECIKSLPAEDLQRLAPLRDRL